MYYVKCVSYPKGVVTISRFTVGGYEQAMGFIYLYAKNSTFYRIELWEGGEDGIRDFVDEWHRGQL